VEEEVLKGISRDIEGIEVPYTSIVDTTADNHH